MQQVPAFRNIQCKQQILEFWLGCCCSVQNTTMSCNHHMATKQRQISVPQWGSWEMVSHRGKWFATAGNGFPLWGVVSCWFLVLLTIYSRQLYIRFPELQALSHSQVRLFRGTSSFNDFQPCLCSAPCGMYHPPSYGCRFRIQRAHF